MQYFSAVIGKLDQFRESAVLSQGSCDAGETFLLPSFQAWVQAWCWRQLRSQCLLWSHGESCSPQISVKCRQGCQLTTYSCLLSFLGRCLGTLDSDLSPALQRGIGQKYPHACLLRWSQLQEPCQLPLDTELFCICTRSGLLCTCSVMPGHIC